MSEADNHNDSAQMEMRVTVSIAPISNADERIVDLFGSLAFDLAQLVGCSRQTSSNANVQTSERTSTALQDNLLSTGELRFEMSLRESNLQVKLTVSPGAEASDGTEAWFRLDEPEPEVTNASAKTIKVKRSDLGGLTEKSSTRKRFGAGGGPGPGDDGGARAGSSDPRFGVIPLRKKPR